MNLQMYQSLVFVEQLVSLGIDTACIVSGSRSTPLTLALVNHPQIESLAFVDERGAAFFALGRAKLTEKPVVVLCTSGTAGANFLPAISEAKEIGVSLLILTADRPHELRISGANQTMDQVKLFGDRVNWFVDMAVMVDQEKASSYARFVAVQAVEHSTFPRGPVHINLPFRKPLQPEDSEALINLREQVKQSFQPLTLSLPQLSPSEGQVDRMQQGFDAASRILMILGPESDRYIKVELLERLTSVPGLVVIADPLSGFRYQGYNRIVTNIDLMLQVAEISDPDLIIQIGEMPISKFLTQYLNSYRGDWIMCTPLSKLTDGLLRSTHVMKVNPQLLFDQIDFTSLSLDGSWSDTFFETSYTLVERTEELDTDPSFEPGIIRDVSNLLTPSRIWIANSLAVRHFDEFIPSLKMETKISSARGVSGIDGTLSSALGTASIEPTLLITGDLAFYHDMNALLIMQRYKIPLIILIINNHGGAIFERLPISTHDSFDEFFYNSHSMNFDKIAEQFGVDHVLIEDGKWNSHLDDLQRIKKLGRGIIAIHTPKNQEKLRQEIIDKLRN